MSRSQSTNTYNTATSNQATNQQDAQNSYGDTQSDIGDYQNALAKMVSSNPYEKDGEYDRTIDTGLANASDAGSASLKSSLQDQTLRTGMNSAGDAATAAEAARQNTRDLSSSLATAEQGRIGDEAAYNQQTTADAAVPAQMEAGLYGTSTGAAEGDLNAENAASGNNKSFMDELGSGFATGVGTGLGKLIGGK